VLVETPLEDEISPKMQNYLLLALNNKLLTWDNGHKRGWHGPNRCPLCNSNSESISHIFISCLYAGQVSTLIKEKHNAQDNWNKDSLEECFRSWVQDRSVALYAGLPSIMVSNIWWAKKQDSLQRQIYSSRAYSFLRAKHGRRIQGKPENSKDSMPYSSFH
jgi:hypothetical protein